jgi:hypothetical protein
MNSKVIDALLKIAGVLAFSLVMFIIQRIFG